MLPGIDGGVFFNPATSALIYSQLFQLHNGNIQLERLIDTRSGPSGTVKLAKKESAKPKAEEKKPAAAKVCFDPHLMI